MEKLIEQLTVPTTKTDIILYMVDGAGSLLSILFIIGIETALSTYILAVTALSLTVTVIKKLHDWRNQYEDRKEEKEKDTPS